MKTHSTLEKIEFLAENGICVFSPNWSNSPKWQVRNMNDNSIVTSYYEDSTFEFVVDREFERLSLEILTQFVC